MRHFMSTVIVRGLIFVLSLGWAIQGVAFADDEVRWAGHTFSSLNALIEVINGDLVITPTSAACDNPDHGIFAGAWLGTSTKSNGPQSVGMSFVDEGANAPGALLAVNYEIEEGRHLKLYMWASQVNGTYIILNGIRDRTFPSCTAPWLDDSRESVEIGPRSQGIHTFTMTKSPRGLVEFFLDGIKVHQRDFWADLGLHAFNFQTVVLTVQNHPWPPAPDIGAQPVIFTNFWYDPPGPNFRSAQPSSRLNFSANGGH